MRMSRLVYWPWKNLFPTSGLAYFTDVGHYLVWVTYYMIGRPIPLINLLAEWYNLFPSFIYLDLCNEFHLGLGLP